MNIGIVGTGYVGLVTGACLADAGHEVICIDTNNQRINQLRQGIIPIYEPGLESLVVRNYAEGRLQFSSQASDAIAGQEAVFIAVGTPSSVQGEADLQYVQAVASSLGKLIDNYVVVINKSTVPVGTAQMVEDIITTALDERAAGVDFDVASNPEFLKEGSAVQDFQRPDRIIIGCNSEKAEQVLRRIYAPFNCHHEKIMVMDRASAELTKYAANCMLATKITFINQVAAIAERTGANIEHIRRGIGSDPRIGYDFLYAGLGYGGSCFPKDVRSLIATAQGYQLNASLLQEVDRCNHGHKKVLNGKISGHYKGNLVGKVLAVWGLAFKANTDDMRESASLELIDFALSQGMKLRVYDPEAMQQAQKILGKSTQIHYCEDMWQCVEGAHALATCTEWRAFRAPDFSRLAHSLEDKVVFDGRNMYIATDLRDYGLSCYYVGNAPRLA